MSYRLPELYSMTLFKIIKKKRLSFIILDAMNGHLGVIVLHGPGTGRHHWEDTSLESRLRAALPETFEKGS